MECDAPTPFSHRLSDKALSSAMGKGQAERAASSHWCDFSSLRASDSSVTEHGSAWVEEEGGHYRAESPAKEEAGAY